MLGNKSRLSRAALAFVSVMVMLFLFFTPQGTLYGEELKPQGVDEAGAVTQDGVSQRGQNRPEAGEQQPATLQDIVVTATRVAESTRDIPQSVTVVKQQDLEHRQGLNPNEMLRESPGIWSVQVTSQGSPVIRGQIGNRVVYLWDGVRINNGALGGGPMGYFNQFPLGAIGQMEVIRGPGSVQYGSDAIGGVINIVSKKMEQFPKQLTLGAETFARFGTVNQEITETADVWLANSRFNIMAGFTGQNAGNYKGPGEGEVRNTGFDAMGGYVNMAYKPAANQTLRISYIFNERDNVDYYGQSRLNYYSVAQQRLYNTGIPRVYNAFEKRSVGKIEYQIDDLGSLSSQLKMYAYSHDYDQVRERRSQSNPSPFTNTITESKQQVLGLGIQNITPWSTSWGEHRFVYGLDYRTEDLRSVQTQYATAFPSGSTAITVPAGKTPNGTYEVSDAFAMAEFRPLKQLILSLGGRVERTHLYARPDPLDVIPNAGYTLQDLMLDKTWRSTTWSAGAIYAVTRELDLVGNVATGFRAPTFSDTLSTGAPVFSSKTASLPSPDTEPEKSITYEFGPRYRSQRWNVNLTGYWTQLNDVVRRVDSGTVVIPGQGTFIAQRNNNVGRGYVRGIEFASSFRPFADWTLFANATFTQGYDERFEEYYRFIPPFNGTIGARYEAPSRGWWVELVEVLVDRLRHHSPTDESDSGFSRDPSLGSPNLDPTKGVINPPLRSNYEIPGYAVTNLRMGAKVWEDAHKRRLDLTLSVNNLLNKGYREPFAQQQIVAPGINAIFGARLKF